ncbi:hypothetical protein GCM10011376_24830 [Nocardioides flavus (ex Wang et al. 2016)]|uniref:ARB-07466-like C-terminal domain-containing protein n=1 Tax=Nocardioides flavus (ex Wang et al. 2016) TaxID=2058780 RepID=A0ABQ3HJM8_9ACTN|nr:hypothetical protein [Nocardioides flavus (ex Wang et al. 2016)]GHE17873.1 hypothetical protein GCM10011376_24830 [Nocardioides flavus (ex Wang et al. 2016)]
MPSLRTVAVGTVVALGAVATGLVLVDRGGVPSILDTSGCTAEVDGHTVEVDLEQAENAALITAISMERGMPARAASIALATAYQESKLYNIDYGDRDSVGLFQQRPSQGWGTVEQLTDPVYATNAFFDALQQVEGYDSMEITVAAQEVQRSAYPDAYADHEKDGRVLASALTGNSPGALWCDVPGDAEQVDAQIDETGLVPRATAVRRDLEARFGQLSLGGFEPGGVSSGHMEGSAHYEGRAVDVFFRPVNAENKKRGWAMASYLVANADRLHIRTIIFDDRIWRAGSWAGDGWRDYRVPSSSGGDRAILEHRDHVHVDVFE